MYKTWIRAKEGVDGFRLDKAGPGSWLAAGPGDDLDYVASLKGDMFCWH